MSLCATYNAEGGVCSLRAGHGGDHESHVNGEVVYRFTTDEAVSKEEADDYLLTHGGELGLLALLFDNIAQGMEEAIQPDD